MQTIIQTLLDGLVPLFLAAAGDSATARDAAQQMLNAYNCTTDEELGLAAEIISFRLHSLEALGQAANPDLSLNRILRLRGSAVSLSREAHKAERRLDQLKRAKQPQAEQPQAEKPEPAPQPPAQKPAPTNPKQQMAQRMAENSRQAALRHQHATSRMPQAA